MEYLFDIVAPFYSSALIHSIGLMFSIKSNIVMKAQAFVLSEKFKLSIIIWKSDSCRLTNSFSSNFR